MFVRTVCCLFLFSSTFAQNYISCPKPEDINQGLFHDWLPLYIDGEELASELDTQQFISGVIHFAFARWDENYLENGHCFYNGTPITQKIILAHDAWRPKKDSYWHWISRNKLAECHTTSAANCSFKE